VVTHVSLQKKCAPKDCGNPHLRRAGAGQKKTELWGGLCARGAQQQAGPQRKAGQKKQAAKKCGEDCGACNHAKDYSGYFALTQ
jgi:hypothetical protein